MLGWFPRRLCRCSWVSSRSMPGTLSRTSLLRNGWLLVAHSWCSRYPLCTTSVLDSPTCSRCLFLSLSCFAMASVFSGPSDYPQEANNGTTEDCSDSYALCRNPLCLCWIEGPEPERHHSRCPRLRQYPGPLWP